METSGNTHRLTMTRYERKRVLITVKAYPQPSRSYDELVCTAGVLEDGSWVRIYPVPFKFIAENKLMAKYQWVEVDLESRLDDFRPESYSPKNRRDLRDLSTLEKIGTERAWEERKKYCLKTVYTSRRNLIEDSQDPKNISLATFKPAEFLDFIIEPDERDWKQKWKAQLAQLDLFAQSADEDATTRQAIRKLPYKFYYRFKDEEGEVSRLMIEDWEIGALYWNCLRRAEGDEEVALEKVKQKYWDNFTTKKDLYLFLGTTLQWHRRRSANPFVIVGVFYPPQIPPTPLFG